jgi:predicted enzyme related to lactoylglutathione lyase
MAATGQIDYVEFPAVDIAKTKKFYSDVFGWKFEDYGPNYTSFTDGRLAGGFYSDPHAETHRPLVVIYAENLEALEAKVKSAGGNIVKPVFSFPGGRRFHFADPGGNELAVWSDRDAAS